MKLKFLAILIFSTQYANATCEKAYLEDFSQRSSLFKINPIAYTFVGTFFAGSVVNALNVPTGGAAAVFTTAGVGPIASSDYYEKNIILKPFNLIMDMQTGTGPLVEKFIQDVDPLTPREEIIEKFKYFNDINAFCEPYLNTYDDMVELVRSEL